MEKLKELLRKLPFHIHLWITALSSVIGCVLTYFGSASIYIGVIGVAIILLTLVYSLLAFRCPHCDSYLHTRGRFPDYCPRCGEKLEK